MASHITRKELKQDKFAAEVEHGVEYVAGHRRNFVLYGGVALAIILVVAGFFYYRNSQIAVRNQILGEAIALSNAPVGTASPSGGPSFPTEAARTDASTKAFNKIISDYNGTEEAYIAEYILAGQAADSGQSADARKKYQDVADHAGSNYGSLAKLALAQLDFSENRASEAEALLKDLIDHPTDLVSKAQATIVYAKGIAATRPDEARKLLTPLTTPPSDISPIASAALADLPQK